MDAQTVTSVSTAASGSSRHSFRRSRLGNVAEAELGIFIEVWLQARQRQLSVADACAIGEDREALLLRWVRWLSAESSREGVLTPVLGLLRFLRANQFNATKTLQMLEDDINWRVANDIQALRLMKPNEILG
jgi:hypothetical protein